MNLSLILTVNNRTPEVSKQVADSLMLPGNLPDQLVVVLDRPTDEVGTGAVKAYSRLETEVLFTELGGEPGWKGPAHAWNTGFDRAHGDLLYCISSEVVQDAGNVRKAKLACSSGDVVVFGACHNSEPENLVVGAEPGLLVSSRMPRPLGFIVCMPAAKVKEIGGFDEDFMGGFWYDDDDFFLRMWRTGVDFLFDDGIHGVHLDHKRPILDTPEGQAGIQRNAALMMAKHGTHHPWPGLPRNQHLTATTLRWSHP